MNSSRSIAAGLIPAKLTSVRLKRKNLADLGGIPLVSHSIRTAQQVPGIDRVYVSSEANEIAQIAKQEGCSFIQRNPALSSPEITNFWVMKEALAEIENDLGEMPEFLVLLQPTHPFRDPEEIEKGIAAMRAHRDATSLIAVRQMRKPVATIANGWWDSPESLTNTGRKNLDPIFFNTGNFYIFRCASTLSKDIYFGDHVLPLEISAPPIEVDVDEMWDLELARLFVDYYPDLLQLPKFPWSR